MKRKKRTSTRQYDPEKNTLIPALPGMRVPVERYPNQHPCKYSKCEYHREGSMDIGIGRTATCTGICIKYEKNQNPAGCFKRKETT